MTKKKEIWNQFMRHLRSKVSKSDLAMWFSQVHLDDLDPGLLVIRVPNKFVGTWIKEHYLHEMERYFERILKGPASIRFSVAQPAGESATDNLQPGERTPISQPFNLNHSLTFDRFTTGEHNKFAFSAARRVAERPGAQYNPLYIFSPWGIGKTHLLHAVGNHTFSRDPSRRIQYLSAETFTSDFVYSSRSQKLSEFRDRFQNLDIFLFDDVHLLAGRSRSQEELLSVFNRIYPEGTQIVITGDRAPSDLKNMNPQLKSRLGSGLIADIKLPDQETKINLIRVRCREASLDLSEDVIFFLANTKDDIKGLMKKIVRLQTFASLNGTPITISTARSLLKHHFMRPLGVEEIKRATAGFFNISLVDLISGKKKRIYSYPRQLAMYLAKKHTRLSLKEIGDAFGHKDHSTVIYAIRRVEESKGRETSINNDISKIETIFG